MVLLSGGTITPVFGARAVNSMLRSISAAFTTGVASTVSIPSNGATVLAERKK
jgi:hypothetical protein